MIPEEQQGRTYFIIGLVVFIVVILVTFTRPAITGYSVYNKIKDNNLSLEAYSEDVTELRQELTKSSTNLSACYSFNEKIMGQIESVNRIYSECSSSLIVCNLDNDHLNGEVNRKEQECNDEVFALERDYNELSNKYNTLAENSANNICCKQRIDNPRINYYTVENNKVICLEEGDNSLSCS